MARWPTAGTGERDLRRIRVVDEKTGANRNLTGYQLELFIWSINTVLDEGVAVKRNSVDNPTQFTAIDLVHGLFYFEPDAAWFYAAGEFAIKLKVHSDPPYYAPAGEPDYITVVKNPS